MPWQLMADWHVIFQSPPQFSRISTGGNGGDRSHTVDGIYGQVWDQKIHYGRRLCRRKYRVSDVHQRASLVGLSVLNAHVCIGGTDDVYFGATLMGLTEETYEGEVLFGDGSSATLLSHPSCCFSCLGGNKASSPPSTEMRCAILRQRRWM